MGFIVNDSNVTLPENGLQLASGFVVTTKSQYMIRKSMDGSTQCIFSTYYYPSQICYNNPAMAQIYSKQYFMVIPTERVADIITYIYEQLKQQYQSTTDN